MKGGVEHNASRMKHYITIQSEVQTPDGAGGYTLGWEDVASCWAEIKERSGREAFMAEQAEARKSYQFTIRARDGIAEEMRILYGVRVFNIRSVLYPVENEKERMQLICEEGVGV